MSQNLSLQPKADRSEFTARNYGYGSGSAYAKPFTTGACYGYKPAAQRSVTKEALVVVLGVLVFIGIGFLLAH